MPADVAVISDKFHSIRGQSAGVGNRQLPIGGEDLKGNACRGDGFLHGIFTLFKREAPELDPGVGFDGRQHLQKAGLPAI
jgi:hypothetical protein